jgi:hypothetical protein
MGVVEGVVFICLSLPVSIFIVSVYVLSALGKSLGFRRRYVQCLLYIFEVSQVAPYSFYSFLSLCYFSVWQEKDRTCKYLEGSSEWG